MSKIKRGDRVRVKTGQTGVVIGEAQWRRETRSNDPLDATREQTGFVVQLDRAQYTKQDDLFVSVLVVDSDNLSRI